MMRYILCANPEHPEMAIEWRKVFAGVDEVEVVVSNIFDISCDALVSPANSQGYMDGGLDLFINLYYDGKAEQVVKKMIRKEYRSKQLPVGKARVVSMQGFDIPYLVVAPTMVMAGEVLDSVENHLNANRAMTAILRELDYFNWCCDGAIKRVAVPALGAGVGALGFSKVAQQMRDSWDQFQKFKDKWRTEDRPRKRYC